MANTPTTQPIDRIAIDFHAHFLKLTHPLAAERPRQGHHQPLRDAGAEQLIELMDRNEVSHAVIVAPSFYGTDNTLVVDAMQRYPDRLYGTVIVAPEISIDELAHMQSAGARGMRLHIFNRKALPDVGGRAYQALFARLHELGMHVEIIVEGDLLPDVLAAVQRCGAVAVLDHFGMPNPAHGVNSKGFQHVLKAITNGNTWVKLSAPFVLGPHDPQKFVDALLAAGGADRLVWGSDWPWVGREDRHTYEECLQQLFQWIPDPDVHQKVLGENAALLLGL